MSVGSPIIRHASLKNTEQLLSSRPYYVLPFPRCQQRIPKNKSEKPVTSLTRTRANGYEMFMFLSCSSAMDRPSEVNNNVSLFVRCLLFVVRLAPHTGTGMMMMMLAAVCCMYKFYSRAGERGEKEASRQDARACVPFDESTASSKLPPHFTTWYPT